MSKNEFIEQVEAKIKVMRDPKRIAALRCRAGKKSYKAREINAIVKRKNAEKAAKKNA